jgi:hypothetical protein
MPHLENGSLPKRIKSMNRNIDTITNGLATLAEAPFFNNTVFISCPA